MPDLKTAAAAAAAADADLMLLLLVSVVFRTPNTKQGKFVCKTMRSSISKGFGVHVVRNCRFVSGILVVVFVALPAAVTWIMQTINNNKTITRLSGR